MLANAKPLDIQIEDYDLLVSLLYVEFNGVLPSSIEHANSSFWGFK